jgi:rsbT co-antagonist protein RsbR
MPDTSPELRRLRALAEELVGPELFARLIESLPDALVVVNDHSEIVLFNAQAEFLFGYHRSEVIGHEIEILIPEGVRHRHKEHRAGFMAQPRVRPMGLNLSLAGRHKSGTEFPVEINLSPVVAPEGLFCSAVVRPRERSSA